jgi:endonuclease YncB( thermonuclease family)
MPIMGQAKVIDGDTLEVGGKRLGLYGIDAFEPDQMCGLQSAVPCGANATEALTKIINGVPLTCLERGADKRQRTLVVCRRVLADISAEMVRTGWAVADRAYSNDYSNEEHIAMGGKGGAWIGPFRWPWEYRGERRDTKEQVAGATQGSGCVFKAHVNSRGEKAYYVPSDAAYNGVRPDALFCSERAAILAGYLRRFR